MSSRQEMGVDRKSAFKNQTVMKILEDGIRIKSRTFYDHQLLKHS
jgi:hypothetical protein